MENLSNWYVRRGRRRYWKSEEDSDKVAAYLTLYEALTTLTQAAGAVPAVPGRRAVSEPGAIVDASAPESVHLCDWPLAEPPL